MCRECKTDTMLVYFECLNKFRTAHACLRRTFQYGHGTNILYVKLSSFATQPLNNIIKVKNGN